MDKELLIRVLGTNNRVVIPTFGAFLRKQQGEALVFSPFLKSDDGFLAGIVREEYDISDDDARQMVASFAEHIASVLRARTKYYVDGVGTLVLDDNGAVSFVMDTTRQIPPSQYSAPQAEAAPSQPIQQQQQAPPAPAPIVPPQPPVNSRPVVAPQPISAARPAYAPQQPVTPTPAPAPAPTPVRPVSAARPVVQGGFARPTQNTAPIAQPQPVAPPAAQPIAQQQQQQPSQPQTPNTLQSAAPRGGGSMNRSAVGAGSNMQQRRRPAARKKAKNDVWLIVAIIAALVVVVLMVVGILTANEMSSIQI